MLSQQVMIDKTNEAISELVYDKFELQKAYNYYAGKRDPEQYRYLEENYGIGNPTSVEFTPLIKKHVDALIGEFLGTPIIPKISCKDDDTISNIQREKQLQIKENVFKYLKGHLQNSILQIINGKDPSDVQVKTRIEKIIQDVDQTFMSQYEIAAQNVIQYIMQSRQTDMITKARQLLQDLLITGYTFFKVGETSSKTNINIEVLNPLNTFVDRNPDSIYIKDSYRVVVRRWYTRTQVLNKYGRDLTQEDIKTIKDTWKDPGKSTMYGHTYGRETIAIDAREMAEAPLPGYPDNYMMNKLEMIPVYEVEWIEVDKDFVMQRYQTIRIGENIYILKGIDDSVVRSSDNPSYCGLSVNGVVFLNRSNSPYSLVLACSTLQDKYDLLHYYRDTIIANSGVKGQIMDFSLIPSFLGVQWPERIQKWLAYKKGGLELIDTTQEGRNDVGGSPLNTIFNGFDDTVPYQAIQAIQMAIDSLEATVSSITGVFRERLNGIEQRDAVSNIKQGVTNSFTITKPYYQQMDLVITEILVDALNQAKTTWRNGLTGTLILGEEQQQTFTALPEHFTFTDFDLHILSTTQIMEDMQQIKSIVPNLIQGGMIPADILVEIITSKSLSSMKYKVQKAIKMQREENNQIQQLSQQLQEAQKQLEQMASELKKSQSKIEQLNEQKMQLEQHKIQLQYEIDRNKNDNERKYRDDWYKIESRKVKIEESQLHDGNPYNDDVNFSS